MRTRSECGFALLFVYAMAAVIAIMLFMALPRVAFEAQRDKEQLLIDRGEQYSRAVTLFVRKFGRYPADIDALQSTQNLRFLRQKYIDPMTGKDEWRLIHVGPGGVFTDSLVYNKKKDGDKASEPQNFITELQQTGGNPADSSQGAVNVGTRNRPTGPVAGAAGDPNAPLDPTLQSPPPGQLDPNQPGAQAVPGQPGVPQPGVTQPGLPQFDANGQPIPNTGMPQTGFPGQMQPGFPGQVQTGQMQPGMPGFPPNTQLPPGFPTPPGAQLNPGATVPTPTGVNLINQILTTPRPGGLPGLNGQPVQSQPTVDQYGNPVPANALTGNTTATTATATATPSAAAAPVAAAAPAIGGGLAGVASKKEEKGIKIYKERKKYNEWEFVYDVNKDPSRNGVNGASSMPPGTPGAAGPGGQTSQTQSNQQQASPQMATPPSTLMTPPPTPSTIPLSSQ